MTSSAKPALKQIALHLLLALGALVIVSPFLVMLRTAFTPETEIFTGGIPGHFTLDNFRVAWDSAPWFHYYWNTFTMCGLIFGAQLIFCLPAAYAMARLNLPARRPLFWLVIACLAVPTQAIALPLYVAFSRAGLQDSMTSLVLPFISSALGIFMFRQFILTIPESIFDAARIDGVSEIAMVWRVVLPNVKPALVAFGVFSVVGHWNDLFWPTVMLRTDRVATVPYAIVPFTSEEFGSRYGPQMAAALLALIPLFIAFLLVQRRLVEGISVTGSQD